MKIIASVAIFVLLACSNSYAQNIETEVKFVSAATHEPVPCFVKVKLKGAQKPSERSKYSLVSTRINLNLCDNITCVPGDGMHAEGDFSCLPIIYLQLLDPKKWEECQKIKAKYVQQFLNDKIETRINNLGINKKPITKGTFN
jgi:hypothetical protein